MPRHRQPENPQQDPGEMVASANSDTRQFDQATFLAHRAIDAATLPPPAAPAMVTLPGAKAAIEHDRLEALQEAGHSHEKIVARINRRWAELNANRLRAHGQWVNGPYSGALEQLRQEQMEKAALELRRRARWEALTAPVQEGD